MVRERIIGQDDQQPAEVPGLEEPAAEERLDERLRPQRLVDVVGQREVFARIEIALDAARKRGDPLGHILFDGPPGLGKTTFATIIPRELGTALQMSRST